MKSFTDKQFISQYTNGTQDKANKIHAGEFGPVNANNFTSTANSDMLQELETFAREKLGAASVDLEGLDPRAVQPTLEEMAKVIERYPVLKGSISEIAQGKSGLMSTNYSGKISFNPDYYKDVNLVESMYNDAMKDGYFPKGTTWINAGVHELGHLLNAKVIQQKDITDDEKLADWRQGITATKIVDEAIGKTNMDFKTVSRYADFNKKEGIAEAFSDFWSNKSQASPLSIEIINIIMRLLK